MFLELQPARASAAIAAKTAKPARRCGMDIVRAKANDIKQAVRLRVFVSRPTNNQQPRHCESMKAPRLIILRSHAGRNGIVSLSCSHIKRVETASKKRCVVVIEAMPRVASVVAYLADVNVVCSGPKVATIGRKNTY